MFWQLAVKNKGLFTAKNAKLNGVWYKKRFNRKGRKEFFVLLEVPTSEIAKRRKQV